MNSIISLIVWALIAGLVIYIVGRLNLGLTVRSYSSAIIAAIVIAIVSWIIAWLLSLLHIYVGGAGLWNAIIMLIVSAIVLMISDRFLPGMEVHGFTGAIIAAIAIAIIVWILSLIGLGASPFAF